MKQQCTIVTMERDTLHKFNLKYKILLLKCSNPTKRTLGIINQFKSNDSVEVTICSHE